MGEQKELGMGKRRGGAGVKVWGPEQGRWKQVCAEEKLLMATPEQGQGVGSQRLGSGWEAHMQATWPHLDSPLAQLQESLGTGCAMPGHLF